MKTARGSEKENIIGLEGVQRDKEKKNRGSKRSSEGLTEGSTDVHHPKRLCSSVNVLRIAQDR